MRNDARGRPLYDRVCGAEEFAGELSRHFDFFTGVPDSVYQRVLPHLPLWAFSPRENHAVSLGFGARMAGKNVAILMQNSGLGLALDALFGTFELYRQGCLLIVSNRGQLPWEEIQHRHWGCITEDLLTASRVEQFPFHEVRLAGFSEIARQVILERKVVAVTVQRGNIDE